MDSEVSQLKEKIAGELEEEYSSAEKTLHSLSERRKNMLLKFEQFIAWSMEEKTSSIRK